ncbi:MAG: glycosyltransferase [Solirubrobacteraceae bacterium]
MVVAADIGSHVTAGPPDGLDVLIVSVGATTGWRAAARELHGAFDRAGARVLSVETGPVRDVRTFMLTDLVQAVAARRAAARAVAAHRPIAVVYCSITAALLWPRPGVIWLDTIAAENRPGRHGLWQRPVERRRLAHAPMLLTMAPSSLAPLGAEARADAVVVPVAVQRSGPLDARRDIDVLAYAADPVKRRLTDILDAWQRARRDGETLVVTGIDTGERLPGVRFAGRVPVEEYRALLRRARVFAAAPRREDFGIGALEALADGAMLVTTPAPGPYAALTLARRLDSRLVSEDLAPALRAALDDPVAGYARRAAELVAPFSRDAVTATISQRVLPRLLPGWGA